jgi:hypothetical protein
MPAAVADPPEAPEAKEPAAPKPSEVKPAKAAKPKKAKADKPKSAKKSYPPEVTAVAKATRAALPEGARSPGAAQVSAVMAVVGDLKAAEAAGISLAKLKKWAVDGERPDEYKSLRDLAEKVNDPWVTSRRLAMVLVGIEDQRKASAA